MTGPGRVTDALGRSSRTTLRRARPWLAGALVLAGCGGGTRLVQPVGEPEVHRGRVVVARGPTMARTGGVCTVAVQAADGQYFNCRIRIRCNGDLVYGLPGAGFNHCRHADDELVFAHDHQGTRTDGDPRMFFDLLAGRVIVSDDDPDVEVLIDLLRHPPGYEDAPPGSLERRSVGPAAPPARAGVDRDPT